MTSVRGIFTVPSKTATLRKTVTSGSAARPMEAAAREIETAIAVTSGTDKRWPRNGHGPAMVKFSA